MPEIQKSVTNEQAKIWQEKVMERRKELFGHSVRIKPRVVGTPRSKRAKKMIDGDALET
jgi:hypothetical protein